MRLHDRYLFRELLTPLAYCLGGFLVFWVAYFFFSELDIMQEHQLRLWDCVEYAAAMMPGFLILVLPIGLLLALLYALTQHSRHHELTALRAAGVSLWRLCVPYFVVGVAAGGIYFGINEAIVPRCAEWTQEILSRRVQMENNPKAKTHFTKIGFRTAHANRIWQIGEYDSTTRIMFSPNVTWTLPDGSWRALSAARAGRTNGTWIFFDAKMFTQAGPGGSLVPAFITNQIAMPEFDETPRQILSNIRMSDSQMLARLAQRRHPAERFARVSPAPSRPAARRRERAAHEILRPPGRAVDVPGGRVHRHPVRRAVGAAQLVFRRGGQHLHLLFVFRAAAGQPRVRPERPTAGVARRVAAQHVFRRRRDHLDPAHTMSFEFLIFSFKLKQNCRRAPRQLKT